MTLSKPVTYGIAVALASILWLLGIFFTDSQFTKLGMYSFLISLLFMFPALYLAIKDKRDREQGGVISLGTCIRTGMTASVVCAMLMGLFYYIYFRFIDHGVVPFYLKEAAAAAGSDPKYDPHEMETAIRSMFSPFRQATMAIIRYLVAGFLFSFICSTFLVRHPSEDMN